MVATDSRALPPSSFDVVLAGDVLHATQDIGRVLAQLRELVVPGGWLVFVEMTREHYQVMTSLELMIRLDEATGDFLDERRGRDQTFLTRSQWLDAISAAGGELVLCLPDPDHLMAELGMHVFAVRFKTDRASISSEGLGRHLAASLPDYMLPAEIQVVDRLPLTDNGKVDRKTLRSWLRRETGGGAVVGEEPQTELERRLAEGWSQVLVVETIGRDQTFFELGGDSLLAAQLTGRVREPGPEASASSPSWTRRSARASSRREPDGADRDRRRLRRRRPRRRGGAPRARRRAAAGRRPPAPAPAPAPPGGRPTAAGGGARPWT